MFKNILITCMLFFGLVSMAEAQTSTPWCTRMNTAQPANYRDMFVAGSIPKPGTWPNSYCPTNTTMYKNILGVKYCVSYGWIVGTWNKKNTLGHGQREGNRVTQQNFNAEVCMNQTNGQYGMCKNEIQYADQSWLVGKDCNSVDYATFSDVYNAKWNLRQGGPTYPNVATQVWGTVDTTQANPASTRCGVWNVTGTIRGDGRMDVLVTNPAYSPFFAPNCLKSFSWGGTLAGVYASGKYRNNIGQEATLSLYRTSPLPQ